MRLFNKVKSLFDKKDYLEICEDCESDYEFVFGILSSDDIINGEPNMCTMNDLDILKDNETGKYVISIETIYQFDNLNVERRYLKELLIKVEKWMIEQDIDICYKLSVYDMFTRGLNINSEFDTLEELYSTFHFIVYGYCNN